MELLTAILADPTFWRVLPWVLAVLLLLLWLRSSLTRTMLRRTVRERDEEISDLQAHVAYFQAQATIDPLTSVANRRGFDTVVEQALAAGARRTPLEPTVMAIVDLDSFKLLNDTLGHGAGDEALVTLGKLLRLGVRKGDIVGRLGGDEFGVLFVGGDVDGVATHLGTIRMEYEQRMDELYARHGKERPATVSLTYGLAVREHKDQSRGDLLARADAELYAKKPYGSRSRRTAPDVH